MKVSEFIKRLEELADVAGQDVDVTVPTLGKEGEYEFALVELQWVIQVPLTERWRTRQEDNTHQIIVIR